MIEIKNSGVDWLGEIPEHWEVRRLKDVTILNPNYNGCDLEGEVSFVPMESLRCGQIDLQEIEFGEAKGKYTYFADEDLLVAKVTPCFENGNIALAKGLKQGVGYGSSEIFVLRCNGILNRYLFYYSLSNVFQGRACSTMCGVGGLKRISPLFMRTHQFAIPPLAEQQAIADYLDKKTAEIDEQVALLEKKRESYNKLKRSLIINVVTRGLNPTAELKDSGIEWIGEIPEHWVIKRFKEMFRHYSTGFTPDSKDMNYFADDEINTWVTIADLVDKYIVDSNMFLSDKAINDYAPILSPKGSLLFSFKLSVGKTAFAGKNLYTNEAIVTIPPQRNNDLRYFYYLIPEACANNATENIYGAKMLNQKIIANMILFAPPIEEQRAISDYLDKKTAEIDSNISAISSKIDAYKRLKQSLIDEVVTGKRRIEKA